MSRKKQWVDTLMTKREAIEQALDAPLGAMLGCGHWGCVFESTPPWVVKFSIDPTEGPIWSKIAGVLADEDYGTDGFVELRSITRLTPDLVLRSKPHKVWAIVREAVEPVFREYTEKELGGHGRGTRVLTTSFTNKLLGLGEPMPAYGRRESTTNNKHEDFWSGIDGLFKYRDLATLWHLFGARSTLMNRERRMQLLRMQRFPDDGNVTTRDDVAARIERVLGHYFRGPHMAPLGESLALLSMHQIYLRDVHQQNIGWHVSRGDDDWSKIVIFDPGHTPTEKADIQTALIENGRQAL